MSNKPLTKPDASKPLPLTPVDSPHKYFPASYVFCVCLKPVSKYFSQTKRNNSLHKYFRCTLFSCLRFPDDWTIVGSTVNKWWRQRNVSRSALRHPRSQQWRWSLAIVESWRRRANAQVRASINILCPSIYVFYSDKISIEVHTFPALTSVQSYQDV